MFIEHAPPEIPLPISPLLGARGEGFTICKKCLNRIHRRGCQLPSPSRLIWDDEGVSVDCDLKEFHSEAAAP